MNDRELAGDAAALGRRLIRRCERAALATSMQGAPYASLVLVAADLDASPLLLISELAQHARNIAFDPRAALLLDGTEGHADRLDGPRLTVIGRTETVEDERRLARFTARHPSSSGYARFADFRLRRLVVEKGHLIAGFGRIEWIEAAQLMVRGDLADLAAAEAALVAETNRRHAAAIERCVERVLGLPGPGWRLSGLDPDGVDLRRSGETTRLDFAAPVASAAAARAALTSLLDTTAPGET
jgi:heme oxygenase (biliverdin-IX-beta and delta-forming)